MKKYLRDNSNLEILRKLTEDLNLRDSILKILELALTNLKYGVLLTDINAKILWCNKYILEISGYSYDELINQYTRIFKSNRHTINFYKSLWDTLLNKNVFKGIIINKRKNGELYNEYNIIFPILDNNDNIKYFLAFKEDLNFEKNKNYLFNKEILDIIPFPIYCLNELGYFVYVNKKMCERYKYTENEFYNNLSIFDINKFLNTEKWKQKWELIKNNKKIELNVIHFNKNNEKLNTKIQANYINIDGNQIDCSIILFQEII